MKGDNLMNQQESVFHFDFKAWILEHSTNDYNIKGIIFSLFFCLKLNLSFKFMRENTQQLVILILTSTTQY